MDIPNSQDDETLEEPEVSGESYNNRAMSLKDVAKTLLIVVAVVAVGMIAVNQTLEFRYRAEFLKAPCKLCLELNPDVAEQCFLREEKLYPNGAGGWQFQNGTQQNGEAKPLINYSDLKIG